MYVIFVVAIAAIACLGLLLDRGLKAIDRGRRRRAAAMRLAAAASRAEQEQQQRKEQEQTSAALTNVLPAIAIAQDDDRGPRRVA
jgi:hypothetical protein